ncbi:hypothetical protein VPH35_022030 [Triticum aestivum]
MLLSYRDSASPAAGAQSPFLARRPPTRSPAGLTMTRRPSASCCELHQDHIAAPPPSSLLPSAAVAMPDAASRAPFPSPAPQDPSPRPLLEQELRLLASRQGRRRPLHLRLVLPAHRRTSASPHPSRCLLAPRFSSV